MPPRIVAFAGAIGSGKTTLATGVSEVLGWPRVGFGDYVRAVARERDLGESREVLQHVGASLIENGWEQFCRAVLAQYRGHADQSLVVDGVRHVEAIDTLRRLVAPSRVALVFIAVGKSPRTTRPAAKDLSNLDRLSSVRLHATERQVAATLPRSADLIVDGSRPVRDLVSEVLVWIRQLGR